MQSRRRAPHRLRAPTPDLISSRDNETLKLVRKLHERRWRDKLGLFLCEGEDLVDAATAAPVELLVAGATQDAMLLLYLSKLVSAHVTLSDRLGTAALPIL